MEQLIDLTGIANAEGVSKRTVQRWLKAAFDVHGEFGSFSEDDARIFNDEERELIVAFKKAPSLVNDFILSNSETSSNSDNAVFISKTALKYCQELVESGLYECLKDAATDLIMQSRHRNNA